MVSLCEIDTIELQHTATCSDYSRLRHQIRSVLFASHESFSANRRIKLYQRIQNIRTSRIYYSWNGTRTHLIAFYGNEKKLSKHLTPYYTIRKCKHHASTSMNEWVIKRLRRIWYREFSTVCTWTRHTYSFRKKYDWICQRLKLKPEKIFAEKRVIYKVISRKILGTHSIDESEIKIEIIYALSSDNKIWFKKKKKPQRNELAAFTFWSRAQCPKPCTACLCRYDSNYTVYQWRCMWWTTWTVQTPVKYCYHWKCISREISVLFYFRSNESKCKHQQITSKHGNNNNKNINGMEVQKSSISAFET